MRELLAIVCCGIMGCHGGPALGPKAEPRAPGEASPLVSHETLPPPAAARDLWAMMCRVLPGTWKSDSANGKSVTESFRVVSASSAIVESFVTTSDRETLSVYHHEGGSLLLTHYCAQGNQPRLRATEISDDVVVFRFVDATNIRESQSVLVEKRLHLR